MGVIYVLIYVWVKLRVGVGSSGWEDQGGKLGWEAQAIRPENLRMGRLGARRQGWGEIIK